MDEWMLEGPDRTVVSMWAGFRGGSFVSWGGQDKGRPGGKEREREVCWRTKIGGAWFGSLLSTKVSKKEVS